MTHIAENINVSLLIRIPNPPSVLKGRYVRHVNTRKIYQIVEIEEGGCSLQVSLGVCVVESD